MCASWSPGQETSVNEEPVASAAHASRHSERGYRSLVVSTIYTVAKRAGVSTATVSRVMSQPEIVSPTTRHKVLQAVEDLGLHAELGGPSPADAALRQAAGDGARHLQPVLRADPPGDRGCRAPRGLRGAARRHAARRDARRALRADAAAEGSRRADLPGPPAAGRRPGLHPQRRAALRAGRQQLRIQLTAGRARASTSTTPAPRRTASSTCTGSATSGSGS